MLLSILNALAPVILLIVLGATLCRRQFLSQEVWRGINLLTYWIALPALLFQKIAVARFAGEGAVELSTVLILNTLLITGLALALAHILKLSKQARGAFIQGSFRGNLAYIGLPVVFSSFIGQGGANPEDMQTLAVLTLAPLVPVYNVLAVVLMSGPESGRNDIKTRLGEACLNIIKNPLIIACVTAFVFRGLPMPMPAMLNRTLKAVGDIALPLALLGVGASIASANLKGNLHGAVWITVLKVCVTPLTALAFAIWFALPHAHMQILLLLSACPTAVASFVLARELEADETLTSHAIVLSTIVAFPVFAIILAVF